jgi:hypothetical protein
MQENHEATIEAKNPADDDEVKLTGYTDPVDPEPIYQREAGEGGDFEAAAGKAKAYVGIALAVIAKLHGAAHSDEGVDTDQADAALIEGSRAIHKACRYIELLVDYRDQGWDTEPKAQSKAGAS